MSAVSNVSNSTPVVPPPTATSSQQVIASLQAQMARYSQSASGQNPQASADYKALQAALKSGNVPDAQAALARLQRDSKSTNSAGATPANKPSSTIYTDGDNDGSAVATKFERPGSLDATA